MQIFYAKILLANVLYKVKYVALVLSIQLNIWGFQFCEKEFDVQTIFLTDFLLQFALWIIAWYHVAHLLLIWSTKLQIKWDVLSRILFAIEIFLFLACCEENIVLRFTILISYKVISQSFQLTLGIPCTTFRMSHLKKNYNLTWKTSHLFCKIVWFGFQDYNFKQ